MRRRTLVVWGTMAALAAMGMAQPKPELNPSEQVMARYVDAHQAEANALLEKLVNMNSGTNNLPGVRAVAKIMMAQLSALGFEVRWVPMDQIQRAGDLVAEHPCPEPGKCGKRLLLIGHMDTVFPKTSPFQKYTIHGNIITGPGTNDMKGGLVDMLYALKAMKAAGVLQHAAITVVLSGDEEAHGNPVSISRRDMIAAAHRSDVVLEYEPTVRIDGVFYGSVSRRSSYDWYLKTTGGTGHSSQIFSPEMGDGAIYELARILDEFRRKLPEKYLTYNVGLVLGGMSVKVDDAKTAGAATGEDNVVAPVAYASGDIRTLSDQQTQRVEAKMRAIVAEHLPKTGATITFGDGYPAMAPTAQNQALLALMNQEGAKLGDAPMPALDPMKRGAGDISFVANIIPGLAGIGATGEGAHSTKEDMDLSAQPVITKRDALLMYRLSQIPQSESLVQAARRPAGE